MIMNPCDCGGLPFCHSVIVDGLYGEDVFYTVRCMKCGNVAVYQWTEDEALANWNENNTVYVNKPKYVL